MPDMLRFCGYFSCILISCPFIPSPFYPNSLLLRLPSLTSPPPVPRDVYKKLNAADRRRLTSQELSYRKQIARQLRTLYVDGINSKPI